MDLLDDIGLAVGRPAGAHDAQEKPVPAQNLLPDVMAQVVIHAGVQRPGGSPCVPVVVIDQEVHVECIRTGVAR